MAVTAKPELLNNREAAEFLRISPGTLEVWRCLDRYKIPYVRIGTRIYYEMGDLLAWLSSRKVGRSRAAV
jgi:hypothetical protein